MASMPQGMPMDSGKEESPQGEDSGSITDLAVDIHSKLMRFMDAFRKAPQVVGPEATQKLGSAISIFQDLVTNDLGSGPKAPEPKAPPASVPVEAGANPNARPL